MLQRTLIVALAVLVSSCSASNGADASNGNASGAGSGGWAASEAVFTARWNNLVKGVYKLSDFQGDRNSKDGATATFLAGEVVSYRGMYMTNIRDPRWLGAACADTIAAALGMPVDDAEELAKQTYSKLETSGYDFGSVKYEGYTIMMSRAQLVSNCTVGPTSVVER